MAKIPNGIMLGHHFCPDIRLFYFCLTMKNDRVCHAKTGRKRPILFFHMEGRGWYKTATGTFLVQAGDIFCLLPEKDVEWQADPADPWKRLSVEMVGSDAEESLMRLGFSREQPVFAPREPEKSIPVMEEFCTAFYANMDRPLFLQETLFRLLNYLAELRNRQESSREIERAKSYMRTNYRQPITVAGIAEMLSLSRSYFSRRFRAETGMSVQDFLIDCRLSAAKQLLLQSDFSIEQVALFCGFRTAAAFSKTFRSREGISSTLYRQSRK